MAINIKFDLVGNPEPPTILLANRNGNILGQLYVDEKSIDISDKFNDASEFSFTLYKYTDDKLINLWDKVVDFKLVYCKEWDTWFEIKVELDESTEITKTVFCTQLEKAELSQLNLNNIEINTEADIERDDYKICILYNSDDADASILNRLLKDKAPHYSIVHVDSTIAKIQRSFSFDGTSIDDAFQKIAEEIGCVFIYHSYLDDDGILRRTISVYDLQQTCNNCGHRGEFTDKCPKCNSTNITNGYGEDTLIFVTSDELASDGIELVTDTDSVKNCFKLETGDDLMTATVRNCNPNGTDYIWYFSDAVKEDMPSELVEKIESYDEMYKHQYNDSVSNVNAQMLEDYNNLVDKYSAYNEDLQKIATPIIGYSNLMNAYYNAIDLSLFLESTLMPSVEMSETNAKEQANLLTKSSLSPVAVADIDIVSLSTANSAVLAMAKIIVKSTFKVEIKSSELTTSGSKEYWEGSFVITNYSDEEDVAESGQISIELNDDLETVTKQKIDKLLTKKNTDDLSIAGLFEKEYDNFCVELKKYALNPLTSFYDACQDCIDILIDQGVADKNTWSDNETGSEENLYEKLYLPYYNKLKAIETEMKIREDEISIISGVYDADGNLITGGLQANIEDCRNKIQATLDFKSYLGEDLWIDFCAYRREDTYSNNNYISDGLNNAELFKNAQEFFEVAENEIYKSAELQHSISTTLNNLLAIDKFKPLIDSFCVGNWIRVQIDGKIFKLRLLEYTIDFGSFENIPVEFSDVTKIKNGITDIQSVVSQVSSMATSYDSVQRQADKGNKAKNTVEQWISDGLNSALVQIQSNDSEDMTLTKNGLLCRSYDDITESYSPEQLKLTHNILAYTDNDWESVRLAIGKHKYVVYDSDANSFVNKTGYGINADFVTAGIVRGSQIIGGHIYSDNYSKSNNVGSYIDLRDGTFSFAGGSLKYENNKLSIDSGVITEVVETEIIEAGKITVDGANITGKLNANTIEASEILVNGSKIDGSQLSGQITSNGDASDGLSISGYIEATSGKIGDFTINKSIYNDVGDVKSFTGSTSKTDDDSGDTVSGAQGVYIGIDGIRLGEDLKLFANGTMSAGKRIYLPNGRSLRGLKYNSTKINWANSNALVWISSSEFDNSEYQYANISLRDRVIVGHGRNSAATDVRSPSALFLKCNGVESDISSKTLIFNYAQSSASGDDEPFFMPAKTNVTNLGGSAYRWKDIYSSTAVNTGSDRSIKKDIEPLNNKYIKMFDLLEPVSYKLINGTSGRTHIGFIAQDVENAMNQVGLTSLDFAGLCKDKSEDGKTDVYSLRYGEFIPIATAKIKQLENKIIDLESTIEKLKNNSN